MIYRLLYYHIIKYFGGKQLKNYNITANVKVELRCCCSCSTV